MVKPSDAVVLGTLVTGLAIAAAWDLRTRRVPNALSGSIAAAGVVFAASGISGLSLLASLAGCALGLGLMMPGHLLGATGAGDVKLFAAIGALLGPGPIARAFLYTAIAGGVLAIVVACRRNRLRQTLGRTAALVATAAGNTAEIEGPLENNRFPYAPAIAAGALIAALTTVRAL